MKQLAWATGLVVVVVAAYSLYAHYAGGVLNQQEVHDSTPHAVTLSGTMECLPHLDTSGPQTTECAFGLKTDQGEHYAINFGQSADAMMQFQSGAHITAEGFVVTREALSSNQWQKYNMKGIFTVTKLLGVPTSTGDAAL